MTKLSQIEQKKYDKLFNNFHNEKNDIAKANIMMEILSIELKLY